MKQGYNLFVLSIILFFTASIETVCAQIEEPVKWGYSVNDLGNNDFELVFKATIEEHWHIYSQNGSLDDGPIPTAFDFKKSEDYSLKGKTIEPKGITKYEEMFGMDLTYFENEAIFKQKVHLNSKETTVKGELTFMVCNDEKCLPPEYVDFEFNIGSSVETTGNNEVSEEAESTSSEDKNETIGIGENKIYDPVKWDYSSEKISESEYNVIFKASVDEGWHLYSTKLPSDDGPIATAFEFKNQEGISLDGEVIENGELHQEYDPNFLMELSFFEKEVSFVQRVKLSGDNSITSGEIIFMACNDQRCIPPAYIPFSIDLHTGQKVEETTPSINDGVVKSLTNFKIESIDTANPIKDCGDKPEPDKGLLGIFLLGFFGGLIALLTPCVFPMIPLTVSFFTKGSENKSKGIKNASLYGFFIFFIYILLSLPFHLLDQLDPEILNTISTNVYLNVSFFVIFIVFAISFFGYFEITLPSSMTNKVDSASNLGGLIGIFFMALTLAIVSFSCTGPILGSLLAGSLSTDGGAIQLTIGMGGFGLALALPFTLFAMFPGWLNSLPRSGGWLNTVKVVLGFLEVAMAIKFLSNADLVEHWGILKREVFFGIWIIIGICLSLYLFGKIKFPHDSPIQKLSKGRIGVGIFFIAFTIYLLPGLTNTKYANLKLLSGFPPPMFYSLYEQENNCPLGINCFKNYEEGLAYAKEHNKPIMLDFTGWACVNCRRMEENVWSQEEIFNIINNDYVLISLYVDDRKELPEDQQFTYTSSTGRKKKIKTIGDKWAMFETENFQNNSQPLYALISPDEILLANPVGYTPNVTEYKYFLECGLEAFNEIKKK